DIFDVPDQVEGAVADTVRRRPPEGPARKLSWAPPPGEPRVLDVPDVRQHDYYSCGAAAGMAVGRYFGVGPRTLDAWKTALGTTVERSTNPDAIAAYLRSLGLDVEARDGMTLDDLRRAWLAGRPVICPV